MEGSLVFDVDHQPPDEDSEDEEALTRKEELQKLLDQELCDDLLDDSEEELTFYSPPPKSSELLNAASNWQNIEKDQHQQHIVMIPEQQDVLKGTSQSYSTDDVIPAALPINQTAETGLYSHLGRSQLEALYHSKCNQMKEMEQQISLFQEEQEKKLGALRHLNRQLEAEKLTLVEEIQHQQTRCNELTRKLKENERIAETIDLIERQKSDLVAQLESAQNTIESLSLQLSDLSHTDAIQRLRQNYETALLELQKQHELQLSALNHQLDDTKSQPVKKRPVQEEELTQESSSDCEADSDEREKERRELIAQVEDLTSQVLSEEEKASLANERAHNLQLLLDEVKTKSAETVQYYKEQMENLQLKMENHQAMSETKLRASLEQCRSACLKLHEDSSKRLKEELSAERDKVEQQHLAELEVLRKELGTLKSKLVTTQQQLLEVNRQKETATEETIALKKQLHDLQTKHIENFRTSEEEKKPKRDERKWQQKVDTAVAAAHKLWQHEEEKRIKEIIQLSLKQVQENHSLVMKKLMLEKDELTQILEETSEEKLRMEQEMKKAKEKLKKANKKSANLEVALQELKRTLPSLQTALVELMSNTLMAQEKWYKRQS